MRNSRFDNFGDLYRAAFAESNPEIKQMLLAGVKKELDSWADSDVNRPVSVLIGSKPCQQRNGPSLHRVA
jgi:hypothetical protein